MNTPAPTLLEGRRILVVEDRYLIAAELCDDVQRLGGAVIGPAATVREAERLARTETFDLALLDVNLDGDPVFAVAEILVGKNVPCLFLTGYDESVLPEQWCDQPRLLKPVTAQALEDKLRQMLADRRL
jgi:DNA-binding response OmpR family regulator